MVVFTPLGDVSLPLQNADHFAYRMLRNGEPYLLYGGTESLVSGWLRNGMVAGTIEDLCEEDEKRVCATPRGDTLVFWSGEVGDEVAVLLDQRLAFVSQHGDHFVFDGWRAVFDSPVTLRQARVFESWMEFNARANPQVSVPEAVESAFGSVCPEGEFGYTVPSITEAVAGLSVDAGRPKIAVSIYCDSHYRSWNVLYALQAMRALAEAGFDCYIIGNATRAPKFTNAEGEEVRLWGDGIYDLCGCLSTVEEQVAFLASMDAVIAPDGGLLQLACAMQKPTIGLFGPTRGEGMQKYAPTLRCLSGTLEDGCAPCWCANDRPPCECKWCYAMCAISEEEIVETAKDILKEGGNGGRRG